MNTGKLIVIDGGDGAGKQTQTDMIVRRLIEEGHPVGTLGFPRYEANTFGKLLRECLDGKRGDFLNMDAQIASTLYAADRFESKPTIEKWLEEGRIIILDRYVSSNMLHQGSKIHDPKELETFLEWLDTIEHSIFKMPRPDLILYCDVHPEQRVKLLAYGDGKRKNAMDLADTNLQHQKETDEAAKQVIEKMNNWVSINCMGNDGQICPREDIHENIYNAVKEII